MENLEDKMDIIEIIALYVKDYVSEKDFENWVYSHSKEIENQVDEELYLDLIWVCQINCVKRHRKFDTPYDV